jgi:predicted nucleic acid binding AN1-type Zn finger protein
MGEYRLYCLNDQGRFSKSHEIRADNDKQALAKARELKLPVMCELWEHGRLVAKLEPHHA